MDAETILKQAAEAARQQQAGGIQGPGVMPQPVPLSVQLMHTQDPTGQKYVVLIISTPVGQNVFHLDPDSAEKIGEGIKDAARLARTGLEIPRM